MRQLNEHLSLHACYYIGNYDLAIHFMGYFMQVHLVYYLDAQRLFCYYLHF